MAEMAENDGRIDDPQPDDDDCSMMREDSSDDGQASDDDNDQQSEEDDRSEYSYYQSSDDEDDGTGEGGCSTTDVAMAAAPMAGVKRKADPLARLDEILSSLNKITSDDDDDARTKGRQSGGGDGGSKKESKASTAKTSTLKAGVGYETGSYKDNNKMINENLTEAAKRQTQTDEQSLPLIRELTGFLSDFGGSEGPVLLSLKLSPGFNRTLFDLLKNDSLLEWGKRSDIYNAVLDMLSLFGGRRFYAPILVHNLLDGLGSELASSCQSLMETVCAKAEILRRTSHRKRSGGEGGDECSGGGKDEMKDAYEMCDRIIATRKVVNGGISDGREAGIIADPSKETTSRDMNYVPEYLKDAYEDERKPPTLQEEKSTYIREMKTYRLQHVPGLLSNSDNTYTYRREANEAVSTGAPRQKRMLRIASEIAGLTADLPVEWSSSIFARVDEDRPDVLKALIVAPEGTPYENGCFEFDVYLPVNYPDVPPQVKLLTTANRSVRFNPNLYHEGKVCLSLLGTWSGPGWIPDTSSLLQVLLSIQSLILVPDPYFNEPGYAAADERQQKQSKQYDRQVRAATLKVAMLGQMKKPSPLFADCIHRHFRLKKNQILKQLEDWQTLENEFNKESSSSGTATTTSTTRWQSALIAGGGIRCSSKIVQGLCEEIRDWYDPDRVKPKEDGGEKKSETG